MPERGIEPQSDSCPHGDEPGHCMECAIERMRVPWTADEPSKADDDAP